MHGPVRLRRSRPSPTAIKIPTCTCRRDTTQQQQQQQQQKPQQQKNSSTNHERTSATCEWFTRRPASRAARLGICSDQRDEKPRLVNTDCGGGRRFQSRESTMNSPAHASAARLPQRAVLLVAFLGLDELRDRAHDADAATLALEHTVAKSAW